MEKKFYTYILQSEKSNKFYIGHTGNIEERITTHNSGKVPSTRNKGPWKCVYKEQYNSKKEANQREIEIKKKKSRKYIEFLLIK